MTDDEKVVEEVEFSGVIVVMEMGMVVLIPGGPWPSEQPRLCATDPVYTPLPPRLGIRGCCSRERYIDDDGRRQIVVMLPSADFNCDLLLPKE